jgi:hypothetical protein
MALGGLRFVGPVARVHTICGPVGLAFGISVPTAAFEEAPIVLLTAVYWRPLYAIEVLLTKSL